MNIVLICLFFAALLPYLAKIPVAVAMHQLDGYDNNHPREQQSQLSGFGQRALAGHLNSFESLLIFSIAILTAIATHSVTKTTEYLAITHVVARIAYHILYLVDLASLRSLIWFIGLICSFVILGQCVHF